MWIKANDNVKVIAGEDRGATGKVLRVNRVYKHVRRSQKNPQGGRLSKEMPIQIGNVQLVCEGCGHATRLGVRYLDNGAKERYCKKCGAGNGAIAPPKADTSSVESVATRRVLVGAGSSS